MNERQRQRCRTLADYLDGVPPERFDISSWIAPVPGCGTVACAAGWAGQIHAFREEGFACNEFGPTLALFSPVTWRGITTASRQVLKEFFGDDNPFFEDDYNSNIVTPAMVATYLREVADAVEIED